MKQCDNKIEEKKSAHYAKKHILHSSLQTKTFHPMQYATNKIMLETSLTAVLTQTLDKQLTKNAYCNWINTVAHHGTYASCSKGRNLDHDLQVE